MDESIVDTLQSGGTLWSRRPVGRTAWLVPAATRGGESDPVRVRVRDVERLVAEGVLVESPDPNSRDTEWVLVGGVDGHRFV
jgi:hypothetical protein